MVNYDIIINSLNNDEIHIMEILGSLSISPNKNIKIQSIKKRVHGKYQKNFDDTIKSLMNKGLIGVYRHNNICTGHDGMIVARKLYDRKLKNSFKDMNFLCLF